MARKRLADGRQEELLDGVMAVIAARGFSSVRIADLASELHCSAASLYKIAPNKDSLVLMAVRRWGELAFADMEKRAMKAPTAADAARVYFESGARWLGTLSTVFRTDVDRFESTRMQWKAIADRFIDRFAGLLDEAASAGQIKPLHTRFVALILRQVAYVTRDVPLLAEVGMTPEEALLEVNTVIWDGIRM